MTLSRLRQPVKALVVAMMLIAVASCGGDSSDAGGSGQSVDVSRASMGADWPLTVDSGTLSCSGSSVVTFSADGGATYAVNGMASTATDLPEIDPIWADDPTIPGAKVNIGPLIDMGLALCEG